MFLNFLYYFSLMQFMYWSKSKKPNEQRISFLVNCSTPPSLEMWPKQQRRKFDDD
jgi:hypothetical protein